MTELLDAALAYETRGFAVVAVDGKAPIPNWKPFQQRRPTPDELVGWWTECSTAGVAIVTGAISRVVVVDVDGPTGEASLARFESDQGRLPETALVRTGGGGQHAYFAHPGVRVKTRAGLAPGLDIRADGGIAVLPPSPHASGRSYEWIIPLPADLAELPPPPAWVIEVGPCARREHGVSTEGWPSWLPPVISEGSRNGLLTRLAGWLHRATGDEAAVFDGLKRAYIERCAHAPPMTDGELRKIALWVQRKAPCAIVVPVDLDPFRAGVAGRVWAGRGGFTDERVALAVLEMAEQAQKVRGLAVSVRDVAVGAMVTRAAAGKSLRRLAGVLLKAERVAVPFKSREATRYRLIVPGVRHTETVLSTELRDCLSMTQAHDLWRWSGLGPAAGLVYARLDAAPQGVKELHVVSRSPSRRTVERVLHRLAAHGLAAHGLDGKSWVRGSADLDLVAKALGVLGRTAAENSLYEWERRRYRARRAGR